MSDLDDNEDSTRGVLLAEFVRRALRAELAESIRSAIPVRVERYDATLQQVDCKPLIKDFHRDETGALVVASVPVIASVPVAFLTGGGFTFTVPIITGETTGTLFFADRSMDRWLSGDGSEVDPEIYVRNSLADAVFVPGVLPFGAPMSVAPPTDHATAGSVTGQRIHLRDDTITVGDEGGAQHMALWDTFATALALALPELIAAAAIVGAATPNATTLLTNLQLADDINPYKSQIGKNA